MFDYFGRSWNFASVCGEQKHLLSTEQKSACANKRRQIQFPSIFGSFGTLRRAVSYAWNNRELATLLTLNEGLAEGGFEPLTIGPMHENLTTQLS